MRSTIKLSAILIYFPLLILFVWTGCYLSFTDYSFDKYDPYIVIVCAFFSVFNFWLIIKWFKVISIDESTIKIKFILPFLNKEYPVNKLVSVNYKYKGVRTSFKLIILKFSDSKEFQFNDFVMGRFEKIERIIVWITSRPGNTIENIPKDFEIKYSIERLKFDIQINFEKIFLSILVFSVLLFISIFSTIKLVTDKPMTDMEWFSIIIFAPATIVLSYKFLELIKKRVKLKQLLRETE